MKYAITLILLGLCQIALAILNTLPGLWFGLLVWSGVSWALAGIAYAFRAAWIFGKRSDGGMNGVYAVALSPFLLVTWLLWHVQRFLTREPIHNEIVPGIWLGRRCYEAELPPGVRTVVDLTAEFVEPSEVRRGRAYICVPILDASIPRFAAFQSLMEAVNRSSEPIYIHCAKGHGRSAMVTIAAILAKGITPTLAEAERLIKQARPGVKISNNQRRLLERWSSGILPSR